MIRMERMRGEDIRGRAVMLPCIALRFMTDGFVRSMHSAYLVLIFFFLYLLLFGGKPDKREEGGGGTCAPHVRTYTEDI